MKVYGTETCYFTGNNYLFDQYVTCCENATNLLISYSLIPTVSRFPLEKMGCQILVTMVLSAIGYCCSEIIVNGDFESELDGTNWLCNSCTLKGDEDAFGGIYSGKITNRYIYYWLVSSF